MAVSNDAAAAAGEYADRLAAIVRALCADADPGAVKRGWIAEQHERGISHRQHRVELEGELRGILAGRDLPGRLRLADEIDKPGGPRGLKIGDSLTHLTRVGVQLSRRGCEEAPAGERAAADVRKEALAQLGEPRERIGNGKRRADDLGVEDLGRRVDGR